jgi:microcystin degradation protein MlrC
MLHGAAVARDDDDPEGTILQALRERVGPDVPVAVSLDHHAHLTDRMLAAVDAVTAYRTCPHVDLRERGAQAARLLVAALDGRIRPVCALARRPMVTPADLHDSSVDPFRSLMALCDRVEADGALAAAMLPVEPWLDVPDLGWKAVVTTDDDPRAASRAAEQMMDEAWRMRELFLAGRRLPVDEALAVAVAGPPPVVVADAGDATNGGSNGDSTELLRAALRRADRRRTLLSICDAGAARRAAAAGVGAIVEVAVGSGEEGAYDEQVEVRGEVVAVRDEPIVYTHPAAAGTRDHPGLAVLLHLGPVAVVVHERRVRVIDPTLYEALGVDAREYAVVQAKSHVSYRAGFARLTTRSVVADTPGPTAANLSTLPYRRRPRPLFPFEPVPDATLPRPA